MLTVKHFPKHLLIHWFALVLTRPHSRLQNLLWEFGHRTLLPSEQWGRIFPENACCSGMKTGWGTCKDQDVCYFMIFFVTLVVFVCFLLWAWFLCLSQVSDFVCFFVLFFSLWQKVSAGSLLPLQLSVSLLTKRMSLFVYHQVGCFRCLTFYPAARYCWEWLLALSLTVYCALCAILPQVAFRKWQGRYKSNSLLLSGGVRWKEKQVVRKE